MGSMGRRKAAAEILSGLSVKTIERRGVDWRTCSDDALIALRSKRSSKWLASFTGYTAPWAAEVLRRAGVDWRTADERDIRQAIKTAMDRANARFEIIRDGDHRYTVDAYAKLTGISRSALLNRRARLGSWDRVVKATKKRPGVWQTPRAARRPSPGRPEQRIAIDGEVRSFREWVALLDLSRAGVWKSAKRNGRSTAEELTIRVRARRSDTAHVAPASVASVQTPRMVRGDQRVSACAASGRGATNDTKEVAA